MSHAPNGAACGERASRAPAHRSPGAHRSRRPGRADSRAGPAGHLASGSGLYLPAHFTDDDPDQRIAEASLALRAGAAEAVTGWAGLHWLGLTWADGLEPGSHRRVPVPLAMPDHRIRSDAGRTISRETITVDEVRSIDGVPLTHPLRSTCFEARHAATLRDAVRWLDWALTFDLFTRTELAEFAAGLDGWAGVRQLRAALPLCDQNVWSPMETQMRLVWAIDLGLARVVTNRPVFDLNGRHVGTPDIFDLDSDVAGEYDGSLHLEGRQRSSDIRRETGFRAVGIEQVVMVSADLRDTRSFQARTLAAINRRADRSQSWTLTPPAWWTPTWTVEQRRAVPERLRTRLIKRAA
jgi:hypothetical protein